MELLNLVACRLKLFPALKKQFRKCVGLQEDTTLTFLQRVLKRADLTNHQCLELVISSCLVFVHAISLTSKDTTCSLQSSSRCAWLSGHASELSVRESV